MKKRRIIIVKPKPGHTLTDADAMRAADRLGKVTWLKDGTMYRGKKKAKPNPERKNGQL